MSLNYSVRQIPLNGTGTEIPNLNVSDGYEYYEFTGTVITTGNYAIVPTGTPQLGSTFHFDFDSTIDITTNGNTFQIFGTPLTQTQLLTKLTVVCKYDGSAWKVRVLGSLDQITIDSNNLASNTVTTSKINAQAVTNSKLAQMANQTIKANISGSTSTPSDIPLSSFTSLLEFWALTGNSSTIPGTNFIGTSDAQNLIFKVNNVEAGRLSQSNSDNNTSFGKGTFSSLTTGNLNTAVGSFALGSVTSGTGNTAIGVGAGGAATTANSVAVGWNADSSGNNSIALGVNSVASANQFAIPDSVTSIKWRGVSYILPATDGTAGQSLKTDGAGTLYWG